MSQSLEHPVQASPIGHQADTITYTDGYNGSYTSVGPGGFNGFVLTFTGVPTITGVSLDPSSQTMNPPTGLSFTSDQVLIEFNGGNQVAGQTSIIDVTTSSVPEPAAWAMMLLGFAGVGAGLRRRRPTTFGGAGWRTARPVCCAHGRPV